MNILFIANHLNVGGISSYLYTLADGLKQNGHNVYIASSGGELLDKFAAVGIKHIAVPLRTKNEISPKIILSYFKLKKEIRKYNIDLLHSNSRTTQVLANLLSRYSAKPHIFTCHGFFKPRLSRRLFPCWGKAVIAISQQVKEHLICDFKLDGEKISVINNGIDLQNFGDFSARKKLREDLGIGNVLLVGIVARLSDVKGHTYLFQAMQAVIKSFPSVKLLVVGEGKMKGVLVKQADDLGIKDNVLFLPQVRGAKNVLAAMDVFVMPSLQEGLGLALMEAMAQGLAVVGSAVGGIKTLIKDKYNGLLVEPADQAALAKAIMQLFSDERMRDNLGANARKFIADNFSKEKMIQDTEGVYRQCKLR
ncbi:MAG: glycosyltransferase family 4 protein [Candidatus Omnitrophica bacterium]|nr:glycosyltransferase family 4 protein [Candidatus Omnitrophota bacterium]MBU1923574.1 glycosyltransferase family 4 protein [Candidatus Omnitrophota bacterium]